MQAQVRRKLRGESKRRAKHHTSRRIVRSCARFLRGSLLGLHTLPIRTNQGLARKEL